MWFEDDLSIIENQSHATHVLNYFLTEKIEFTI